MKIKNATRKGYLEVGEGGCFDMAFPDSKYRRGRVIGGGYDKQHVRHWMQHRSGSERQRDYGRVKDQKTYTERVLSIARHI